jgi:hypothetical protein
MRDDRRRRSAPKSDYVTVFRTSALRYTSTNQIVIGIAIAYLALAFFMVIATENSRLVFPSPVILFLAWRYGWNRSVNVHFFVQKNAQNDLYYGFMDEEKQRNGDILFEEFTYWFTEQPSIGRTKNYTLYVLLKYGEQHTIYLKEPIKLEQAPEGWPLGQEDEDVENKTGVFQVPGLRTLAKELEAIQN